MLYIILTALVATYIWFFYTSRATTVETTGYIAGATARTITRTARAIKLEADIAKTHNSIADIESPRHTRIGRVDGAKAADDLLSSVGIDNSYFDSRGSTLSELKSTLSSKQPNTES